MRRQLWNHWRNWYKRWKVCEKADSWFRAMCDCVHRVIEESLSETNMHMLPETYNSFATRGPSLIRYLKNFRWSITKSNASKTSRSCRYCNWGNKFYRLQEFNKTKRKRCEKYTAFYTNAYILNNDVLHDICPATTAKQQWQAKPNIKLLVCLRYFRLPPNTLIGLTSSSWHWMCIWSFLFN